MVGIDAFLEVTKKDLVPVLVQGLQAAVERHQIAEDRGADGFSFGTDAWSLPARIIRDRVLDGSISFEVAPEPGLVLLFGEQRFRHHRVGTSSADNIWSSFPRDAKAASIEAQTQLELELTGLDALQTSEPLVVAYMANEVEGLCAVYLCSVGFTSNGRIAGWTHAIEVWRAESQPSAEAANAALPPAEVIPSPLVTRPRRAKRENE